MTVASFKVCVERSRMGNMNFIEKFEERAPGKSVQDLSSDEIEEFIRSIVTQKPGDDVNSMVTEESLKDIKMPMQISEPSARMMEFINEFFERLESVGYGDFEDKNPGKTIKLLQSHLFPSNLKAAMCKNLEYQQGLKKNLKDYLRILTKEAIIQHKVSDQRSGSTVGTFKNKGKLCPGQMKILIRSRVI